MIIDIDGSLVYNSIESLCWVPWLRFSAENFESQRQLFPEGQFAVEDEGQLVGYLSTTRVQWDGEPGSLPSWDELAEPDFTFARRFRRDGNTLALMSISILPSNRKINWASLLIAQAQAYAARSGLAHVVGDFRPNNFGAAKVREPLLGFAEYVRRRRPDGFPQDEWLRSLTRQGLKTYRVDSRAMVIPADLAQFDQYRQSLPPHLWWRVTDPRAIAVRLAEHRPEQDLGMIEEVWECGQTGTWYVNRSRSAAVYIESNFLGELPVEATKKMFREKRAPCLSAQV